MLTSESLEDAFEGIWARPVIRLLVVLAGNCLGRVGSSAVFVQSEDSSGSAIETTGRS